ncbi:MAG: aldo/keto reductase [Candidatus Nanopelagicales bacterium]|jgi:aryl-alcohol dehydrogenase-like predicted oxidoreductase
MNSRTLGTGSASLEVTALGLGCMGMNFAYGKADDVESVRTLDAAMDAGIRLLDTSDSYGPFDNEELIGGWLRNRAERPTIATKFGQEFLPDGGRRLNGRPEYARKAVEGSLRRLGVDRIDLYYLHRVDPAVPVEETWGAMSELVTQGKVGCLGISEASASTLQRIHAVHPVTAVQTEWSLWTRDVETNGVLATARALGIGFVAYSPLGRGYLTGAIRKPEDLAEDDGRRAWPRFSAEALDANRAIADGVADVAARVGCTPAQAALAWLLHQGDDVVPIPGSRKVSHLMDNVGALNVHWTARDSEVLESYAPIGAAVGQRYPEALMKSIDS